jgi:seryl-tRNA synthetase
MQRRSVTRVDPRYKQLRTRNNDSVKKSRDKARREQDETAESITQLEQDNQKLTQNLQILKQEYEQLQNLFKQHTGIDIDQVISSEPPKVTSTLPTTTPPLQPKESSSKPVLTINTNEDKPSSTSELDATNLDGSVVLINGIQYKIVSMNKT